jgi:signal transduction histidine kinase
MECNGVDVPFTYILTGGLALGYLVLAGVGLRNRRRYGGLLPLAPFVAAITQAVYLLVPDAHQGQYAALFIGGLTQPALAVLLGALFLVVMTGLSRRYLGQRAALILMLGLAWWVVLALLVVQTPGKSALLGQPAWITVALSQINVGDAVRASPLVLSAPLLLLLGIAILGVISLLSVLAAIASADLSEIANRALYWLVVSPLVFMGALLSMSGSEVLREGGWVLQYLGVIGAVYGAISYRVIDVRRMFKLSFASAASVLMATLVILAALLLARDLQLSSQLTVLTLLVIALVGALIYLFLRGVLLASLNQFFGARPEDATSLVRQYSQEIAGVVELTELADIAVDTLRKTLRVRRGALLLATRDDNDTLRLEPMFTPRNSAELPNIRAWVPKGSPIYRALAEQRKPLLQYDIEFSPYHVEVAPEIRSFFKSLRMSAYAPILIQGQLIGVLAAGAKANDDPFSTSDLEILATIATQNGVALRNARLVNDLRTARDETQALNTDIIKTKERLEQLDSVKTDFITIASHELRTPLAQIRGYTDILEAVSDQKNVDVDQVVGMTNNLRKATDRLERLIADMLDVSQLGLDAMDLRFAQTTIENVIRLAIEPLADPIKQRKLQLTAKKLKELPSIEADMQRLVQAFRNIVLNAIKYTPDGGRIDITGRAQQNEITKQDEVVISIQDTGIGIEPRFHEVIFEKFFRIADPGLHSTGATKFMGAGPGLGLTIARGVIQGHGGRIWVASAGHDPEKLPGTTVHVLLPVNPPANARRVQPLPKDATSGHDSTSPKPPTRAAVATGTANAVSATRR